MTAKAADLGGKPRSRRYYKTLIRFPQDWGKMDQKYYMESGEINNSLAL